MVYILKLLLKSIRWSIDRLIPFVRNDHNNKSYDQVRKNSFQTIKQNINDLCVVKQFQASKNRSNIIYCDDFKREPRISSAESKTLLSK